MTSARSLPALALAALLGVSGSASSGELAAALRFRVIDAHGAPVAARARWDDRASLRSIAPIAPIASIASIAPGEFETDPVPLPPTGTIWIDADGYESARLEPALGRASAGLVDLGDVVLFAGRRVELRVEDPNGAPVRGAGVHSIRDGAPFPPRLRAEGHRKVTPLDASTRVGTSDDAGRVTLGLPVRSTPVVLRHDDFAPREVWVSAGVSRATVALDPGARLPIELLVPEPFRLGDEPIAGRVDVGGLVLNVPLAIGTTMVRLSRAGPISLSVEARTYRSFRTRVGHGVTDSVRVALEPEPLGWARISVSNSLTRRNARVTRVQVGRARDDRVDRIDFVPRWDCLGFVMNGAAWVAGPDEPLDVLIAAEGCIEELSRRLSFRGTHDAPAEIELAARPAPPISGRVIDGASGAPIRGAAVRVARTSRDLDDLPLLWRIAGSVGHVGGATTDADGRFDVASSAWERIRVEVDAPGYARLVATYARTATDGLELEVATGHAVSGRVNDARPGHFVYLQHAAIPAVRGTPVRVDGSFRFEHVPSGAHRVYVDRDDRDLFSARWPDHAHALAGEIHGARDDAREITVATDVDDLVLDAVRTAPRPARLTIFVDDPSDRVARVVALRLDDRPPALGRSEADAVGRQTVGLPGVATGAYSVIALDASRRPVGRTVVDVSTLERDATIDARPAAIVVRAALSENGTARLVADEMVRHRMADGVVSLARIGATFDAGEIVAGPWRLELCDERGDVVERRTVELTPGATTTVDVAPR